MPTREDFDPLLEVFFLQKKKYQQNHEQLVRFNFFKLLSEIPPRAMIGLLLKRERDLNLLIPK